MHRTITAILALIFMLGAVSPIMAANEGDTPSAWAKADVEKAIALGYVPERLQSSYQEPITREEFAELIVTTVFAKLAVENKTMPSYWTQELVLERVRLNFEFEDAKEDHIKLAYILGSINGVSETHFAPDRYITRQEAAAMLVNTSHVVSGISYSSNVEMKFSDFGEIAEWAKPAVQAAYSVGFMQGVGGKFDYAGYYTREQSIVTMINLARKNYDLFLRGNIRISSSYEELVYTVSKDKIKVHYTGDKDPYSLSYLEDVLWNNWISYGITSDSMTEYTVEKAIVIYAFSSQVKPRSFSDIVDPTLSNQSSAWDYGWMEMTTFNKDSIVEFKTKPIGGYMVDAAGYRYGYPFQSVTVTRIK